MSIRYNLASAARRAAGTKKLFALPEEELLEAQPTQTETPEAGQAAPAAQQPTQSPEGSAAEQETALKAPTAPETPAQEQQEEGTENT